MANENNTEKKTRKFFNIALDEATNKELTTLAAQMDISKAELTRRAIASLRSSLASK